MSSYDITFCSRKCGNFNCKRNQESIKDYKGCVSIAYFNECKEFKETKNATNK